MKETEPKIDGRKKHAFKSVFRPENLLLVLDPIIPNLSFASIKEKVEEKCVSLEQKLGLVIDSNHREELAHVFEKRDLVGVTLIEAGNFPRLDAKQEKSLAQTVIKGKKAISRLKTSSSIITSDNGLVETTLNGAAARELITCCNWRLVISIAKKFNKKDIPLVDLCQEGAIALMKAVEGFNLERDTVFSTYATNKIKWHLIVITIESGYLARIPRHLIETVIRLNRIQASLELELKRKPTDKEIAAELEIDPEIITRLRRVTTPLISLDSQKHSRQDGGVSFLYEFISDEVSPTFEETEEKIDREILKEKLGEVITSLPKKRERLVLEMYWGLNGYSRHQLKEVGEKLGVTPERVRQIKDRALKRLSQPPYRDQLEPFF